VSRLLLLFPLFAFAPAGHTAPPAADVPAAPAPKGFHHVELNGHTFTLPVGFTIEVAAGADLAPRPIVAAFDEKGRLYVCDSSGSNDKVAEQVKTKPHRVVRLEDTDGDGKYDKSVVYVANVMLPEGAMWLNGSLYVAAPPHIWKFTDTDGDGKADKEEIWFDGKTLTGCANDLHGPYLGPDGWIYWCKGAFAKQEYTLAGGKKFTTRASHIFRARPDGTGLEPVMTGGMDNPVDVVFTPSGERIFSCTFLQHPANGKRDGLIHAVYGAVYGKDHDPVYEHPWTSPKLMEPMTHLGPAAPCGLHRYESDQFGKDYDNNLFCCQFNLRKVSRHVLVPSGSTFTTTDSDFVVSDQHDFHPTDVIEDADGSLLVVDTGGWYKLCCPSSQLVKPDVTGAIYRVKRVGVHKARTKLASVPLSRLYTIALNRDCTGLGEATEGLRDPDLRTRRLAAEAVGRIGDKAAVPALLEALADGKKDRVLDHAVTNALIEIGESEKTAAGIVSPSPRVRRAALTALSYISDAKLDPKLVLAELDAKDAALRETAWWIAGRHPQWGDRLAGYFRDRLKGVEKMTPPEQDELVGRCVPFLAADPVRKAVGDALAGTVDTAASRAILRGLARSGLKTFPAEWTVGVQVALFSGNPDTARDAIAVLRAVPPTGADAADLITKVRAHQQRLGRNWPAELDYALRAVAPAGTRLTVPDATTVIADVHRDRTGPVRAAAADWLTRSTLAPESLVVLAAALKTANTTEVGKLLPAFGKSADGKVGLAVVAAMSDPALRTVIRVEQVKPLLDKYPKPVKDAAERLYALLAEARKDEQARLEGLLKELPTGDVRRGQAVFNGAKAQCAACHKIGYVGGLVGPDLTRVGGIRTDRDLLEAIVFPSASFVRSYEPVRVTTADGRVLNGILKKDAPDEIVLAVGADKDERVARTDVESITPGTVSVMPAGLDQQLTRHELADLVAFLKACK